MRYYFERRSDPTN